MLIKGCGEFTDSLWEKSGSIFDEIISLPFNRKLSDGTLPKAVFCRYLEQDILYLQEDTRAIAMTAERAPEGNEKLFFTELVTAGIALEEALHAELASAFGISVNAEMNKACRDYTGFLTGTAQNKSYHEAVSALLPCYWIYQNAGIVTASNAAPGNPYQAWLDTYSGDEFTAYTEQYIRITEAVAERAAQPERGKMADAFIAAARHELDFLKSISF